MYRIWSKVWLGQHENCIWAEWKLWLFKNMWVKNVCAAFSSSFCWGCCVWVCWESGLQACVLCPLSGTLIVQSGLKACVLCPLSGTLMVQFWLPASLTSCVLFPITFRHDVACDLNDGSDFHHWLWWLVFRLDVMFASNIKIQSDESLKRLTQGCRIHASLTFWSARQYLYACRL